jgi:hypothetical protein
MARFGQQLRARITYANVTATAALIFALSGGAYAAVTLPRKSVGSAQIRAGAVGGSEIRNGAVRSRDVRNRSLQVSDLSTKARDALRGNTGPAGPAGRDATTFRASVTAGGDPVVGNATGDSHAAGSNVYRVTFGGDVSGCVPAATLAAVPSGSAEPPAGRITLSTSGSTVSVRTFDAAGAASPAGFNLIVAC